MSDTIRVSGYGVLIGGICLNDMLQALTHPLTMEQKKLFYIGHKVIEPSGYNDMDDHYKARYDSVDIDAPDFLITDFGNRWMEFIDMYMDTYYPLLTISPTTVLGTIAIYAMSTKQLNQDIPDLLRSDYPAPLHPSNRSMALPARNKSEPLSTVPATDKLSVKITEEHKEQLSGFLRDTGISIQPEIIVWEEMMARGGWQGCIREPWRYRKNNG